MSGHPGELTRTMENAPRNAWYVVAGCEEIGEGLLSRRVLDTPLVLFRTSEGKPVALFDRCPHRWMPLSMGNRLGDVVQCLYHGIEFDGSGACARIPTQNSIPEGMRVRSFPLVDKHPFTWIWVGDEDKADPSLIPEYSRVSPDLNHYFLFCYPMDSHFLVVHENLMDTSHPTYLHAGYFDDGQLIDATAMVETEGNLVRLTRDVGVIVPGPGTAGFYHIEPGMRVHQVAITETIAPSLNTIHYRFAYVDEPDRRPAEFVALVPITPSTPHSAYHFVANAVSWEVESLDALKALNLEILEGDKIAVQAIEHRRMESLPGEREMNIRSDTASLHLRHIIQTMARKEDPVAA